ncbi:MAG: hypothetical protein ISS92_02695 [Candidatus Omnitrophica bacterium]|nr:hypothetical protein [Candidatus Omnitrophota bacterium]
MKYKLKSKSLANIEEKMESMDESSLRYQVLKEAKSFKTSWVGLGQMLCTVWKDKHYKEWGFSTFDTYTLKEIGIKKPTALKLLKSYHFMEQKEPTYISREYLNSAQPGNLPTYESVNALRLAGTKKALDEQDYKEIKESVLGKGRDATDVRKAITSLIKQREELEPQEARKRKREAVLKRFIGTLRSINREAKITKILPENLISETDKLIGKLEREINS